jgi:small subunit ribosomal protein S20
MANIKSAKKRAKTNKIRRTKNNAKKSEIKTVSKKIFAALSEKNISTARDLLVEAEAKIARAGGKGIIKKNTAIRKISRLAKKVASIETSVSK